MKPVRLKDGYGRQAELLREAVQLPPFTGAQRARLRHSVRTAVQSRSRFPLLAFATAAAVGVAALAAVLIARPAAPRIERSDGAQTRWLGPNVLEVVGGSVTVSTRASFRMVAPELEVAVTSGKAAVAVSSQGSAVDVFEGSAVVRRAGELLTLIAPAHLDPPAPPAQRALWVDLPEPDASCGADVACLERLAEGDGLRAQLSLLRLSLAALNASHPADAEQRARTSLARFPDGAVAPETHLVRLQALAQLGRSAEAQDEARWYLDHAPQSPAAPDVALLRGDLALREGKWVEARDGYQQALTFARSGAAQAQAWHGIGLAEQSLGHRSAAERAFRAAQDAGK
jgi:TolA-binding protein